MTELCDKAVVSCDNSFLFVQGSVSELSVKIGAILPKIKTSVVLVAQQQRKQLSPGAMAHNQGMVLFYQLGR